MLMAHIIDDLIGVCFLVGAFYGAGKLIRLTGRATRAVAHRRH